MCSTSAWQLVKTRAALCLSQTVALKFWNSLGTIPARCTMKTLKSPCPGNNKEFRMTWMKKQSIVLVVALAVVTCFMSVMPEKTESAQDAKQNMQSKLAAIESITVSGE